MISTLLGFISVFTNILGGISFYPLRVRRSNGTWAEKQLVKSAVACEHSAVTLYPRPHGDPAPICTSAFIFYPSPLCSSHTTFLESESESCSVMSNSLQPHGLYSAWNSSGQNTGVGSLSLLQGIFPTQGSNPGLPHWRRLLYQLSHRGSPRILEWVAYPFSSGSSRPRNRTGVSCIAGGFFTNWDIREAGLSCCSSNITGIFPLKSCLFSGWELFPKSHMANFLSFFKSLLKCHSFI